MYFNNYSNWNLISIFKIASKINQEPEPEPPKIGLLQNSGPSLRSVGNFLKAQLHSAWIVIIRQMLLYIRQQRPFNPDPKPCSKLSESISCLDLHQVVEKKLIPGYRGSSSTTLPENYNLLPNVEFSASTFAINFQGFFHQNQQTTMRCS